MTVFVQSVDGISPTRKSKKTCPQALSQLFYGSQNPLLSLGISHSTARILPSQSPRLMFRWLYFPHSEYKH